jgi:hypothetical protein
MLKCISDKVLVPEVPESLCRRSDAGFSNGHQSRGNSHPFAFNLTSYTRAILLQLCWTSR